MSQQGSKAVKDGVQVIQGTPTAPITSPTLFLRLWRVTKVREVRTRATLFMVRPGPGDYVIKELIPDMELDAQAALDKAVAIAKRGDASVVYSERRSREDSEGAYRRQRASGYRYVGADGCDDIGAVTAPALELRPEVPGSAWNTSSDVARKICQPPALISACSWPGTHAAWPA